MSEENKKEFNENELFSDENKVQVGWFKFEKVGDRVMGTLEEVKEVPESGDFEEQVVFVLKQEDGENINVGFGKEKKRNIIDRAKKAKIGDIIGFQFLEEIETEKSKKFKNPAKSIGVYIKPTINEEFN